MIQVLAFLAQDAGVSDGNLSERLLTITVDVLAVESNLAEVRSRRCRNGSILAMFSRFSDVTVAQQRP
jgi:hypothetical protein